MKAKLLRILLVSLIVVGSVSGQKPSAAATVPAVMGDGSLQFVENIGQFDGGALFQVRAGAMTLWLARDAVWLTIPESVDPEVQTSINAVPENQPVKVTHLKLSFTDTTLHPRVEPFTRLASTVHYYRGSDPGQWYTQVPVWGGIRYANLYPGIDLEITGENGTLAWHWVRRTNYTTTLDQARLRIEGSEAVQVENDRIRMTTCTGDVVLPLPRATWTTTERSTPRVISLNEDTVEIAEPFAPQTLAGSTAAQLVPYDETTYFGSYLGGSNYDWVYDIAVSGQGDILDRGTDSRAIWIAGWTVSSNFPSYPGTTTLSGPSDAFVTRIKRGATIVAPTFSAYIGGADEDGARGIATDNNGNV